MLSKKTLTNGIIVLVFIIVFYLILKEPMETFFSRTNVLSSVDKRKYNIVGKYEEFTHDDAANKLARLNRKTIELLRHLRRKYIWGRKGTPEIRERVLYLVENYDPDVIRENAPLGKVNTSYVRNKGDVIAICLREKRSGENKFHDDETLQFVKLHEITHIFSKVRGHPYKFWKNFKFILQEAVEAGLYKPIDYAKYPVPYCGIEITYNPYFDINL